MVVKWLVDGYDIFWCLSLMVVKWLVDGYDMFLMLIIYHLYITLW